MGTKREVRLIKRGCFLAGLAWALVIGGSSAHATNTRPELDAVMADLLAWLPGEYSSAAQREVERRLGAPPDGEHPDWYRVFARVDVPHIGEHVIYGQMHVGGKSETIVRGTQVLYIVSMDEAHGAVSVSGRRIKDPGNYESAHLDPAKLKTIALDPDYGGNCDFRWRRHGSQIVGRLAQPDEAAIDGTCTMTSKVSGVTMTWDAEWVLNPNELWIYDNGYIEDVGLFQGREDRTHIRLTRVQEYDCEIDLAGEDAPRSLRLNDGGGTAELGDGNLRLTLLHIPYPVETDGPGAQTVLTLVDGDAGDAGTETAGTGRPAELALETPAARVSCRLIQGQ